MKTDVPAGKDDEGMPWRRTLASRLSEPLRTQVIGLPREEAACLTEIRVRTGCRVQYVFSDGKRRFGVSMDAKALEGLLASLCAHSRYAFEEQMARGYIPLPGGHRAGICGRAIYENGHIVRMSAITSVCIRIARKAEDASLPIRAYLCVGERPARILLLGPPGSGKTTVLRDAAEYLAEKKGFAVAAADEREELFADGEDAAIDILRGADKSDAVTMLVRTMSPQFIVCDELGKEEEARALLSAASCGVGVLASAHADSFSDVRKRPALSVLYQNRAFDWYILLAKIGRVIGVMDAEGKEIT